MNPCCLGKSKVSSIINGLMLNYQNIAKVFGVAAVVLHAFTLHAFVIIVGLIWAKSEGREVALKQAAAEEARE